MDEKLPKVIIICGPTASGKTGWSLRLAKKFNGEIISADSRQIYKKMDIGTGKEIGEWKWNGLEKTYFVNDLPHYLIDFLDPGQSFSTAEFRDKAIKHIQLLLKNKRVPLVVGGTGLYIRALVDNLQIPRVAPNKKMRESLNEKSNEELLSLLKKLDPQTAATVDFKNKRRLIRALEVCIFSGAPFFEQRLKGPALFDFLQIGIDMPREVLYDRINTRIDQMMAAGLLAEVKSLVKHQYSWDLPSQSGIGYRQFRDYFEGKISLDEAVENLKRDSRHYAKRQLTWFKRDKRVQWVESYEEAERMVGEFLKY